MSIKYVSKYILIITEVVKMLDLPVTKSTFKDNIIVFNLEFTYIAYTLQY